MQKTSKPFANIYRVTWENGLDTSRVLVDSNVPVIEGDWSVKAAVCILGVGKYRVEYYDGGKFLRYTYMELPEEETT